MYFRFYLKIDAGSNILIQMCIYNLFIILYNADHNLVISCWSFFTIVLCSSSRNYFSILRKPFCTVDLFLHGDWKHLLSHLVLLTAISCHLTRSYLLEQDFPGMRIGPEPTTDSFIAVMHGDTEGVIPGNALVVDPKKPFRKLNAFGNAFLNR